jgi:Tol biopolymer transport system component
VTVSRALRLARLATALICAATVTGCGADDEVGSGTGTGSGTGSSQPSALDSPSTSTSTPGPWIAFQAMAGDGDGVFLVTTAGEDTHQLAADVSGEAVHPAWSPDGTRLAFVVFSGDSGEVWVADEDGGSAHAVTQCGGRCLFYDYVAWVPGNPERLLVVRDDGPTLTGTPVPGSSVLEIVDLRTGKSREVVRSDRHQLFSAVSVSPDGRQYCAGVEIGDTGAGITGSAIVVGRLARGPATMITEPDDYAAYCDWHPQGHQLVYTTHDLNAFQDMGVASNLYLVAPDGTGRRQLTDFDLGDKRATQPRWTPDGRQILFTLVHGDGTDRDMAFLSADGEDLGWATGADPLFGTHPVLQPVR